MSKAPASQFYWSDWSRDLGEHPLEIEGAWIRICCSLFWSETSGKATKTLTNWARVMRVGEKKSLTILTYLLNQKIADGEIKDGQITIVSRRQVKDAYIREIRKKAGHMGGNPRLKGGSLLDKQTLDNQKPTPSSSSSSSIKKNIYGEYRHVKLTDTEHQQLIKRFGQPGCDSWIKKMDEGIELKGYKYKSHYLAILKWAEKDDNPPQCKPLGPEQKSREGFA
jgi:hypothetical protein